MAQISAVLRNIEPDRLGFWCPGCNELHAVRVGDGPHPRWSYNGNPDRPTFSPSIKVTYRHPKGYSNENPAPRGWKGEYVEDICHSFVRDGQIQFLGDCTHDLAGKTVPLPPLPADWTDN